MDKAIRKGERSAFDQFYRQTRPQFLGWAKKQFGLAEAQGIDLFQQSMLVLYEQALSGKLETVSANLTTYFFGIAKNLQLKTIRHEKVKQRHEDAVSVHLEQLANLGEGEGLSDTRKLVRQMFPKLKQACQDLLKLFYFENKKTKTIAQELDYKSAQVVRTQKSRCLKYLRELIDAQTDKI